MESKETDEPFAQAFRTEGGGIKWIFDITALDGPESWGLALADLTRHIGNAGWDQHARDPQITVAGIARMYIAELLSPTSPVQTGEKTEENNT